MTVTISINVPRSWNELTNQQLYYLYRLFTENLETTQCKVLCLLKWGNIKVQHRYTSGYVVKHNNDTFVLSPEDLASAASALDWIDEFPSSPVRISTIKGHKAVSADFQGVELEKYLYCENLYQGYIRTTNHALLADMGRQLYSAPNLRFNQIEKINIFYWWAALKSLLATSFPNFFQPLGISSSSDLMSEDIGRQLMNAMNTQIRALTKGDITKEKDVLKMDVWRAFAELDAQAKEYEEFKRKYPNNG